MIFDFALPEYEKRLIPEGRLSGGTPWIIAIMAFLTVLAAAAGLIMFDTMQRGGDDLSRQITVQILEPSPDQRNAQRDQLAEILRREVGVNAVEIVPDAEIRSLLTPWLGSDVIDADIPVPALVEVTLDQPADKARLDALQKTAARIAPTAKLDSQADWIQPFFKLMGSLLFLTLGILLLLLVATAAAVTLAVRGALNNHRETLEIMHMMGGTDMQAARLFQRRMALDTLLGSMIGFFLATLVIWLLSTQFDAVGSSLLSGSSLPWYGWIVLALIPLAVMGLAMLIARWTVLSALKKIL